MNYTITHISLSFYSFDDVLQWIDHAKYLHILNKKNNKVKNLTPNHKNKSGSGKIKMSKKK